MILRFSSALVFAGVLTLGLFVAMQMLIANNGRVDLEKNTRKIIDFVQVKTDAQVIKKERTPPEKPQTPDAAPPDMPPPSFDNADNSSINNQLALGDIAIESSMDIGGFSLGPMEEDAEYLPIMKAPAQYPKAAARRGLEGYVIVEYTVTTKGSVKDVKVIEAKPQGVFERSAMAAASRYKYKPKLEGGKAVEVKNVSTKINFKLSKKKR